MRAHDQLGGTGPGAGWAEMVAAMEVKVLEAGEIERQAACPATHQPSFLITIDTEGDNIWQRPRQISTENAKYLPRFQVLCERYGLKPVYLTNYEMAVDPAFVEFGMDAIRRGTAEIGMHLHAWNSPPIVPLTQDDHQFQPYLVEYPEAVLREKVARMTGILEDTFQVKMKSHRAGRWAFDEKYARALVDLGYEVDCSVTPGVDWRKTVGAPQGAGGTDYRAFPPYPYFLDFRDIRHPGKSPLLEVPMTTRRSWMHRHLPWIYRLPLARSIARRIAPPVRWLRPEGGNLHDMLSLVREAVEARDPCVEFMLHSSEFMPGGSPTFRDASAVEALFDELDALFGFATRYFAGATLAEFGRNWRVRDDHPV